MQAHSRLHNHADAVHQRPLLPRGLYGMLLIKHILRLAKAKSASSSSESTISLLVLPVFFADIDQKEVFPLFGCLATAQELARSLGASRM
jgi:hypothetical protein